MKKKEKEKERIDRYTQAVACDLSRKAIFNLKQKIEQAKINVKELRSETIKCLQ